VSLVQSLHLSNACAAQFSDAYNASWNALPPAQVTYPYSAGDREACSVFFVWEMLRPLLGGLPSLGTKSIPVPLYVIPDDIIYNPARLVQYLGENAITRVLFTPSLLQLMLDTCSGEQLRAGLAAMRIIWLCGEVRAHCSRCTAAMLKMLLCYVYQRCSVALVAAKYTL
jgi:hypothetical protein